MNLFVMDGRDRPDSLELRKATRDAHLAWIETLGARVRLAGPVHDETTRAPAGSIIIIEADNIAAARTTFAADPYSLAGLWGHQDIRPFTWVKP